MTRREIAGALFAIALLCAPRLARAQDTSTTRMPPGDTMPPPRTLPVNGSLLRPEHLRYQMSIVWPDSTHAIGTRIVDVTQSSYGAFPAWLLAERRDGSVPSTDTLYLSYVDLRPLHWSSVIGPSRLALEFTADSIYGATSGPSGHQNIALPRPGDLLAGGPMTELVLQLMPHAVGRVDSVSVLEIDLGSHRITPGALTVEGEQDVDTALGQIHCWVISLSTAGRTAHFWVAESNPVVVQVRQDVPGRPGAVFEQRLIAAK
ncbi:MAG: hypothetical protein WBQ26_00035 [Gemmatimonadaceae bacterium]|nr:hypothetical protein [Gemmatimonadaceae bacterium]